MRCPVLAGSTTTTSERILRTMKISGDLPSFPSDAFRSCSFGVAVASVQLDPKGKVSSIQMLQSPAPSISKSISQTLSNWRFKPYFLKNGQQVVFSGLLTFYFEPKDGRPVVLNPNETGYVGHWPLMQSRTGRSECAKPTFGGSKQSTKTRERSWAPKRGHYAFSISL